MRCLVGALAGPPRLMHNQGAGDRWLAGEALPGVEFALHDAVEIVAGPLDGERGTIALLMSLVPEPSYLVTVSARGDVRVRQGALRRPGSDG